MRPLAPVLILLGVFAAGTMSPVVGWQATAPRITVGGLRIVGPGAGQNASELQAFHERPGTAVALMISAPAGAGIVGIDDRTSKITAFTDDKGASLLEAGRFGPFPKVSDDGSAAMVEIEVGARPSAGATSLSLDGAVSLTMANGSKPQRIPSVRLEVGQKITLGTTPITVKTIEPSGESTSVTLGLSRQFMSSVRAVRFLTVEGAIIESRRTGSGYMNDNGEFDFDVKTKAKVVTLEFDMWQNLQVQSVPFSLKIGLGIR